MKTRLYIGQPPPDSRSSTILGASRCTCFGTVAEAEQYAAAQKALRSGGCPETTAQAASAGKGDNVICPKCEASTGLLVDLNGKGKVCPRCAEEQRRESIPSVGGAREEMVCPLCGEKTECLVRLKESTFVGCLKCEYARSQMLEARVKLKNTDRCISLDIGEDGSGECSPLPHTHRVRFPGAKNDKAKEITLRVCANHLKGYLNSGWVEVARMVCTLCTTNEPMTGDSICENCAKILNEGTEVTSEVTVEMNDAQRLKAAGSGFCLGRDYVHGCLVNANPGNYYCTFCQTHLNIPEAITKIPDKNGPKIGAAKIRTIPSSARPCTITNGCAGTMTGAVRKYGNNTKPELWWTCAVCGASMHAARTHAVMNEKLSSTERDAIEDEAVKKLLRANGIKTVDELEKVPVNADLNEFTEALKEAAEGMPGPYGE